MPVIRVAFLLEKNRGKALLSAIKKKGNIKSRRFPFCVKASSVSFGKVNQPHLPPPKKKPSIGAEKCWLEKTIFVVKKF